MWTKSTRWYVKKPQLTRHAVATAAPWRIQMSQGQSWIHIGLASLKDDGAIGRKDLACETILGRFRAQWTSCKEEMDIMLATHK